MNATPLVRDFGLMPGLVAERRLTGVAQEIFLARLNVIHAGMIEMAQKQAAKGN